MAVGLRFFGRKLAGMGSKVTAGRYDRLWGAKLRWAGEKSVSKSSELSGVPVLFTGCTRTLRRNSPACSIRPSLPLTGNIRTSRKRN